MLASRSTSGLASLSVALPSLRPCPLLDFALAHKIQNEKHQRTAMGAARSKQRPSQQEVTPRVMRDNGRRSEWAESPSVTQSLDDTGRKARGKNSLHYQFSFCAPSAQKPGPWNHTPHSPPPLAAGWWGCDIRRRNRQRSWLKQSGDSMGKGRR